MNIDIHTHFLPKNCFDVVGNDGKHYGPSITTDEKRGDEVLIGGTNMGPIARQLWDSETRIKDMDAVGVDIQVLSPIPYLAHYNLEAEACLWYSRKQNDGIAQVVNENPTRFIGLATVPIQEPDMALAELDRAISKLKLRGIEILTNVNGRQLDAPELHAFYKEVEALDVPVLIHPSGVAGSERMRKYYLANLVGNPLDTTLAAAHLIFGGILEKFPGLKFCLAHGGGNLPYIRGRLEHGYHVRPECSVIIKRPPSYYIHMLYFETITHSVTALEYLISSVGADKIMLGSDYPFDMGDPQPVSKVRSLIGISEEDKQKVLGGNSARLFKL